MERPGPDARTIVLIGLMGAGKTTLGRACAASLGRPFLDSDEEIERRTGSSIPELFARRGEAGFRVIERQVIGELLERGPIVLASGGGAFLDDRTRALIGEKATSVWLRCPLSLLTRRVAGSDQRPLLHGREAGSVLAEQIRQRGPIYALADIVLHCRDEAVAPAVARLVAAIEAARPLRRVGVPAGRARYDIVIGAGLLERAGALLAPRMPQRRAIVVTDERVADLHLPTLLEALDDSAIIASSIVLPCGEQAKSMPEFGRLSGRMLDQQVDRHTTVIALGGGVVGDVAGFAAATVLRGLPLVQIPTTLLAQVDSSVGGKVGINTSSGKNLIGAFHQPLLVLADVALLSTLPLRELRAGYAEIVKAALVGDPALLEWCEANGPDVICGNRDAQLQAIEWACRFKASVICDDEREEASDGRALLNLGHSFAHALEAERGYDGSLLHGEAVSVGIILAIALSERLGLCSSSERLRVETHFRQMGMPAAIGELGRFSTASLVRRMKLDKKMCHGKLGLILLRGIGQAFSTHDVDACELADLLVEEGCVD